MNKAKKMLVMLLMVFGVVSVSWAVKNEYVLKSLETKTQYVKEKVEYLEDLEKK